MLLKLKNVKKNYKINKNEVQEVLKDINLTLKNGEFVCIYGESGSGKSTLMNIIGGLDDDYIGTVTINKKDIKKIDKDNYRRDKIGFVFQNFNLIPYLSVFENVMIMLDMTNVKQIKKIKMVESALEKVGLLEYKNKKVTELSGGQKQRVALARAIINEPDIILADEPTGALDSKNADKVLKILKQISNDGKLVIVVTHSNKVKKYSSRVITIEDGLIKKDEILKNVKNVKKKNKSLKRNLNSFMCVKLGLSNIIKNLKRNILLITASSIGVIGILISLYIGSGVKKYISNELKNNANPLLFTVSEKGKNELYDVKYYSKSEIDKIRKIFKDKVSILTGQTGVGKSSLINKLEESMHLKTNEISKALGRGKHTTRHSELYDLAGGFVADTPGFSSLSFINMTKEDIRDNFIEFNEYKDECKYRDCMHVNEDDCEIKRKVKENIILKSRYENYVKFIEEKER